MRVPSFSYIACFFGKENPGPGYPHFLKKISRMAKTRYAPDAGSADILKNHKSRKLLFLRENGFRKNDVFIILERQTAKTKMTARTTRRYHVFIQPSLCDGIC